MNIPFHTVHYDVVVPKFTCIFQNVLIYFLQNSKELYSLSFISFCPNHENKYGLIVSMHNTVSVIVMNEKKIKNTNESIIHTEHYDVVMFKVTLFKMIDLRF